MRWLATLASVAAGLTLAVGASAATIDPPIRPSAPPGVSFAPASPTQPSRLVEAQALATDAKVSVDEAMRRLDIQDRVEGVESELRDALGPAYAGRWLDHETGDVVVATTGEKSVDGVVDDILAKRDLLDVSKRLTVASSLDDLEAAQADLNRMVDERFKPAHARTGIDLVNNRVMIWLGKDATDEERQLVTVRAASWRKGSVDVGRGSAFPPSPAAAGPDYRSAGKVVDVDVVDLDGPAGITPDTCNATTRYCDNPIRGGVRITGYNTGGAAVNGCSAGFLGYWVNAGYAYPYLITAGHCIYPDAVNWKSTDAGNGTAYSIGTVGTWRWGPLGTAAPNVRRDIAIIQMPFSSHWTNVLGGEMVMWGWPAAGWDTWLVHSQSIMAPGDFGCRSGASSNYTCGSQQYQSITAYIGGQPVDNMYTVPGACGIPGDSGGSFMNGTTALGTLSGSDNCTGYYEHVYDAGYYFGVWVWTS